MASLSTPKKSGAWSRDEDYSMLHQLVTQLIGAAHVSVNWAAVNVPGRTPRAIKEHWGKIATEVNAIGLDSQGPAGTPKVRAPRTKKDAQPKTPKGKGGNQSKRTPKKRKLEEPDEDIEEDMSDLKDTTDEEAAIPDEADDDEV